MNKLAKTILFAAAFAFVAGCAHKPSPMQTPAPAPVKMKAHHPSRHCKGRHHKECMEKMSSSVDENNAK